MTGLLLDTQLTETQHEWLNLIEVSGNALLSLVSTSYHHSTPIRPHTLTAGYDTTRHAQHTHAQMIFLTWQRWKAGR